MAHHYLCKGSELAEGCARGFDPRDEGTNTIFVVRKDGRLHAYRDACPHYGDTPLAWRKDAYLDAAAARIVCSAHGAQFAIDTGICTLGPCLGQALAPVPLAIAAPDDIYAVMEETQEGTS